MRGVFLTITLFVSVALHGQNTNKIESFKKSASVQGCNISCLAVNLTNGDTIFSHNRDQRVVPASLLKLFTTSAALEELGGEYQFKTVIGYRGAILNGVLEGDLVVQGFGDPTFGSSHFSFTHPDSILIRICKQIKATGIRSIAGDIVLLNGYFDDNELSSGRLFEDMGNYYGASPKSISWRDNSYTLYLKSSDKVDEKCRIIGSEPKFDLNLIVSNVYSSTINIDSAYIYPSRDGFVVRGSIPLNQDAFAVKGVLSSPASQFGRELHTYLVENGVLFLNKVPIKLSDDKSDYSTLLTLYSPPLKDIIAITNQKSNNLFADALFLHLGKRNSSRWQWSGGALELSEFWESRISSHLVVEDGSGLSPRNLVTATQVVDMLRYEFKSTFFKSFNSSLAVSGSSGTLKRSFICPNWKFYGKSGSMKGVLCYGGYVINSKGDTIAVAVMVNNFTGKNSSVKAAIEKLFNESF